MNNNLKNLLIGGVTLGIAGTAVYLNLNTQAVINATAKPGSSNTQLVVSWKNDTAAAWSFVRWGKTAAYGKTTQPQPGLTNPSILILNGECNTGYHLQAVSVTYKGDTLVSGDLTATTKLCNDTIKPVITDLVFNTTYVPNFIPNISSSLTCKFTMTAIDDKLVTGYYFAENSNPPSLNQFSNLIPSTFTFSYQKVHYPSTGFNTMYAWARDAAGNMGSAFQTVWIDSSCKKTPIQIVGDSVTVKVSSSTSVIFSWKTNIIGINYFTYWRDSTRTDSLFSLSPTDPNSVNFRSNSGKLEHGNRYYGEFYACDPCGHVDTVKKIFPF